MREDGRVVEGPAVLDEIKTFYETLYTSKGNICKEFTKDLNIPKLDTELRTELDEDLTSQELSCALKEMANEKSPGLDGLPAEFYKVFWGKLKEFYHEVIKECISDGELHLSARRGLLSLLEKLGKNILKLHSWRPLTLLSVDGKIYTKALARRLQKTQKDLINEEQTGFVKGRQLATNIIKIMELMETCDKLDIDGVLISFDFLKAFDTVEWDSVLHALDVFVFGEKFKEMVKVIFKNPLLKAYNNGYMSDDIKLTRGTRQGCCFSPVIFTFVVELLGLAIRQNNSIEGIFIGEAHVKSGQFADDLWASLKASEDNINNILRLLFRFYRFSGLRINNEKCSVLRIGPWKDSDAKFYTLKKLFWSPDPVGILGFKIFPDMDIMIKENFHSMFKKIDKILASWSTRNLTVIGKICVVNSLVNSLFVHKLIALPDPGMEFYKSYKERIMNFIWDGKIPKIAYDKLIQDYDKLGLKLVDMNLKGQALKAAWVTKWTNSNDRMEWLYETLPVKDKRIWECNLKPKDIKDLVNLKNFSTVGNILYSWSEFNFEPVLATAEEILNTVIWGNSLIRRANKVILDGKLVNSKVDRLMCIYDFVNKRFMRYQEVKDAYDIEFDQLFYLGILAAIPNTWKIILRNENYLEPIDTETKLNKMEKIDKVSKFIYWELVQVKFPAKYASKLLWEMELKISMEEEEWFTLFREFRRQIRPTKLLYLQYRILNRALTTNIKLYKWNKVSSENCSFCKKEKETVIHLLIECDKVKKLWTSLEKSINYFLKIRIQLDPPLIILNNYKGKNKNLINLFIVSLKHHIYASKCLQEEPDFKKFMAKLSHWYQVEKYLVYQDSNYNQRVINNFYKKWNDMF